MNDDETLIEWSRKLRNGSGSIQEVQDDFRYGYLLLQVLNLDNLVVNFREEIDSIE
jgi:hypothetical protein